MNCSVQPELENYKFGNGGLLQSVERVTVPIVLAQTPLLLSYSVVDSPVLSMEHQVFAKRIGTRRRITAVKATCPNARKVSLKFSPARNP